MVDVNLSELQKTLDKQGIELVDNQKENVVGRKALAEKTKGRRTVPAFRSVFKHCFRRIQENPRRGEIGCIQRTAERYQNVLSSLLW